MKTWILKTYTVINSPDEFTREQVIAQLINQKVIKGEAEMFELIETEDAQIAESAEAEN